MPHADTPLRRLVVAVDAQRYSGRDALGQVDLQQALIDAVNSAADASRLDRSSWHRQAQGDAELVILSPETNEAVVVADFPRELASSLRRQNRSLRADARLRLRIAIHVGLLHMGALGYPGPAPVETCRLLDAPILKETLAASDDADLALIVSAQLFKDVVMPGYRGLRPELFREVQVKVKEYAGTGYMTLPGLGAPSSSDSSRTAPAAAPSPGAPRPAGDVYRVKAKAVTFGPDSPAFGGNKNEYYYGSG